MFRSNCVGILLRRLGTVKMLQDFSISLHTFVLLLYNTTTVFNISSTVSPQSFPIFDGYSSTVITITIIFTSCQAGSYFEVNGSGLVLPSVLNINNVFLPIRVLRGLPISVYFYFYFFRPIGST